MTMRTSIICLLILFIQFNGSAQQTILYDTSTIQVRHYPADKMSVYKTDPAFQYERTIEPPSSRWRRFWDWVWSLFTRMFETPLGALIFNYYTLIIIAVVIIVFFIMKLTGMTDGRFFGKKNTGDGLSYTALDEDIHSINFNEAIQQAVDEGNFRLAVRLLYLQSLKNLTDNGKINWQVNKTNLAYLHELSGTVYEQQFFELTKQFEYNWYGNWPATEPQFAGIKQTFNDFNKQLSFH